MASLYKRPNSEFWWVKFRDPATGEIRRESSKCRIGIGAHLRRAKDICAQKTSAENQAPAVKDSAAWELWVIDFLRAQYATRQKTLIRYLCAWKSLRMYLEDRKIRYPSQLAYKHAADYVEWRQKPSVVGLYWASRVTAVWEVKFLRLLTTEAIRRGLAVTNPFLRLGIAKGPTREKPEITDAEIMTIRQALKTRPEWMQISFEIAIHQGCRFAETCLPVSQINLERMEITFDAKGGRTFTTKLHDALVPLISRLKAEGRSRTYEMPVQKARDWTRLFRKIGLRHLCFHCTRVTVITRLCRANVSESQAMRFVGHASETIHRVYQRLRAEDVGACVSALRIPSCETQDLLPATLAHGVASSPSRTKNGSPHRALRRRTKDSAASQPPVLSR